MPKKLLWKFSIYMLDFKNVGLSPSVLWPSGVKGEVVAWVWKAHCGGSKSITNYMTRDIAFLFHRDLFLKTKL